MNKSDNIQQRTNNKHTPKTPLTSSNPSSKHTVELNSSTYLSSNYIRYLNHLSAQQSSHQDDDYHVYWSIVTKSILYLKRELINDQYHHQIMVSLYKKHFNLQKLDPTPTTEIGQQLIRCGYFLAAYAILLIRLRGKGKDLLEYFQMIYSKYKISFGEAQLRWYISLQNQYTRQLIDNSLCQSNRKKNVQPLVRLSTRDTLFQS